MQASIKPISALLLCISIFSLSCKDEKVKPDYRAEMRKFVEKISEKGEEWKPGFLVVPQNGLALLSSDGTAQGNGDNAYITAIDGVGQEEVWYGYDNRDDEVTPEPEHTEMLNMCLFARNHGLKVLVTDYAASDEKINDSYAKNFANGFISFTADHRELDNIPLHPTQPYNYSNSTSPTTCADARNFLYIINPSSYNTKEEFITALENSRYDVYVIDLYFNEDEIVDTADLNRIRRGHNGSLCKILCYMSTGEAEAYRWYWKPYWYVTPPEFLVAENPSWPDNFVVRYWDPNWQNIICGSGDSYLRRIVNAGFDGVYLDLVSQYEYFEE